MATIEPARNRYVGHRYVPLMAGEWTDTQEYEGLSVVTYQGASYTSKKRTPIGIPITNGDYWVLTGNYNAQVEQYRDDVERYQAELTEHQTDAATQFARAFDNLETRGLLANHPPPPLTGIVADGTADDTAALQAIMDFAFANDIFKVFFAGRVNITSTLILPGAHFTLEGVNRYTSILEGHTGDTPVVARKDYANPNVSGGDGLKLANLRIFDHAVTRPTFYTVELTNGHSSELEDVEITATGSVVGVTPLSAKYGAILGKSFNSAYSGDTFLAKVKGSRFGRAKVVMNTTDWFILDSEIWGNDRDFAVMVSGGGFIGNGTQIVGGATYGAVTLYNENNYDITTLKIIGTYFDGSYSEINSGAGVTTYQGWTGALVHANINHNNFWHQNKEGIFLEKAYDCDMTGNTFEDCDADDTGESDIVILSGYGNKIDNQHFRSLPPKVEGAVSRVNTAPVMQITSLEGLPYNEIGGKVAFMDRYENAVFTGKEFLVRSESPKLYHAKTELPSLHDVLGLVEVNDEIYYNTPTRQIRMDNLSVTTGLVNVSDGNANTFVERTDVYVNGANTWTNLPAAVTGDVGILKAYPVSTGYTIQELYSFLTNVTYHRRQDNGVWTAWQ